LLALADLISNLKKRAVIDHDRDYLPRTNILGPNPNKKRLPLAQEALLH
jgi:hypothetical protein